jgi:hypothetical protein
MDEFQIKINNKITVAKVELVIANALDCFNTLQEATNSYHTVLTIRDINFNQELS